MYIMLLKGVCLKRDGNTELLFLQSYIYTIFRFALCYVNANYKFNHLPYFAIFVACILSHVTLIFVQRDIYLAVKIIIYQGILLFMITGQMKAVISGNSIVANFADATKIGNIINNDVTRFIIQNDLK